MRMRKRPGIGDQESTHKIWSTGEQAISGRSILTPQKERV
jgi:hypothetical protein